MGSKRIDSSCLVVAVLPFRMSSRHRFARSLRSENGSLPLDFGSSPGARTNISLIHHQSISIYLNSIDFLVSLIVGDMWAGS